LGVDPSPQTAQLHPALGSTGTAFREDVEVDRAVAAVINLVQRASATARGGGTAGDDRAVLILDLLRRTGVTLAADRPALAS
jgi:lipopolysaccharide biosynthesis regulator YciM